MAYRSSNQLISQSQQLLQRQDTIPFYIKRAKGPYLYDFDQHKFIDFFLNNGTLILGHSHPKVTRFIKNNTNRGFQYSLPTNLELRLAKLIIECCPAIEIMRFFDSKIQIIHELTKLVSKTIAKEKCLFIGDYDEAQSQGIFAHDYDLTKLELLLSQSHQDIGAICIAPVSLNNGFVIRDKFYWQKLQELCARHNILFILDEEITGFRLALGGACEYYGINPDLRILGSIIAGGFPLYALGGKKQYFDEFKPQRSACYYPLYYAAGLETIKYLRRNNPYPMLHELTQQLCSEVKSANIKIHGLGSIFSIDTKENDEKIVQPLLEKKIFIMPPLNHSHFISAVHSEHDIKKLIDFCNHLY